ncbi:MAG: nodulation protein NolW [Methylotenera sp.]|nr:nodulation protein NolW [Methylotenera sp.]
MYKLANLLLATVCILFALLLPLGAMAVTDFKIITLQHRFAEDILPVIQPLAGNDATVTGIQNHIMIRANPKKMLEIEQAIVTLDVVHQNLKITVSRQHNLQAESDTVAVSGRKRIGNVTISTNQYPGTANARNGVQVELENNQSQSRNSSNQFINVIDGGQAFILVGQSVPFTQEWLTLTQRYAGVQRTTEFIDVSTGFSVRARSLGNQVELEITPRIAQLNQQNFIDFEELSTVVRVNKGEWFDLSGTMQQKDEISRAILSRQTSRQSQENAFAIRVDW